MAFSRTLRRSSLICVIICAGAAPARAQSDTSIGVRAAGMGGAFTAVADDATAVAWNPAGLASGSYASAVVDWNHFDRQSAMFAGIGTPPLGIAYYRTATADLSNGRNTLVAHHTGLSLVQSLGDTDIAVGGTLKVVRGVVSDGSSSAATIRFDGDVGVMASGGLGQIGLSVRNIVRPSFAAPGGGAVRLDRRVRGGIAVHLRADMTIAADVDFTKAQLGGERWRDAAVGVESHPARNGWVRAGIHWNTAPAGGSGAAPVASVGASYALRGALKADAQASVGSSAGNRGWGVGLRFAF